MVTRQRKGTGTKRRAVGSAPRHAPTAMKVPPVMTAEMKSRLNVAGHKLQLAGQKFQVAGSAATKFARSYVREVTTAARASREPMQALWRNFRLAGRHIARDAAEMWQEMAPARKVMKLPVVRRAARPAA
jgi:hypothetical protein